MIKKILKYITGILNQANTGSQNQQLEYSEHDDFKEHKENITTMYECLAAIDIAKNSIVLDIGGGQGMHACFLAQQYQTCYCTDILDYQSLYDGHFPQLFQEKCQRNNVLFEQGKLHFVKNDAMDMLFDNEQFDFITSFNALEHIPDPLKAIQEMIRVCKPNGFIYITFDPIWTADTGSHFIHRVPDPWAHLVESQQFFCDEMRSVGAAEDEIDEFKGAMNQLRLPYYQKIFKQIIEQENIKLIHHSSFSGLVNPDYRQHANYKKSIDLGYTEEELNIRGMRYVFQKIDPVLMNL